VGDHTLYIFILHIMAFKIVTALKVAYYGLDWGMMGTHMVVHYRSDSDAFFLLYTIVGVAVPLLAVWMSKSCWNWLKLKVQNARN